MNQERELERAFLAGWNAHETGLDSAADGPALGFRMFLRGHNFGDEERGEDLTIILALRSGGEGWRLVPVEPTREMANAALVAMQGGASTFGDWRDIWAAMLSAAPSPSTHGEG